MKNEFVFYFWFVSFKCLSIGLSLNLKPLHIEIHIPFGFIKIGIDKKYDKNLIINHNKTKWRGFGYNY